MKRYDTIIGIDPGSTNGAIAVWRSGEKVKTYNMPKNSEIKKLKEIFEYITEISTDIIVFIEVISMFVSNEDVNQPAIMYRLQQLFKNYNYIEAFLIFLEIPYILVYPQSWQSVLKLNKKGIEQEEKKRSYKKYAQNTFPEIKVTLKNADALCILQFAFVKFENDIPYLIKNIKNEKNKTLFG